MKYCVDRIAVAFFAVVLSWLCTGSCNAQMAAAAQAEPQRISAEVMLDWIERYRNISPENAELLRQSLDRQADPAARLELALLELHAPLSPSAEARGLERLNVLIDGLDTSESGDWIAPLAIRWLLQWQEQMQALQTLQQQAQNDADRLERERRAHLATLEKLDALRSIERELEQRQVADDTPQAQSESPEDETDETVP